MVTINVAPSDVEEIRAEIARIDARIRSLDDAVAFYTKQLNGATEQFLFSEEEIAENPHLVREQRVLFPAIVGALQKDAVYQSVFFDPTRGVQPIIDKYETERRALTGQFADFTIPGPLGPGSGLFDENLIQVSGGNRILPLFEPTVNSVEPLNPGQMFGGTSSDPNNENAELTNELTLIASLLTPG
jgi:hypothetical protein